MRSVPTPRALRFTAAAATAAGLALALAAPAAVAAGGAEPSADLVFGQTAPIDGVAPGSATEVSFTVKNKGDAPATRVALFLDGSQGLAFAERYSNCRYEQTPAQDEGPAQVNAVCDVEQTLEPGVVYAPEEPVAVNVLDRALYEQLIVTVQPDSIAFPEGTEHGGGADPVLRLVAQEPPADPGGTYGGGQLDVDITAENTADFALTGASVTGKAGDTVTAEVTFANRGPAWARNDVYGPIGVFDVAIPKGTTATKVPEFCLPVDADGKTLKAAAGAPAYRCTTPYGYADEDSERPYAFDLRIDKVIRHTTGKVAFVKGDHRWGTLPFDENPGNNQAEIVVNASGDAGTSGGSGGTASGGGTEGTGPRHDTLADTGADTTALIGGSAAAALLAGAGLLLARRRRSR